MVKGKETRLEQLLTPPPVLREDFVSPKLATKLAQQLKVGPLLLTLDDVAFAGDFNIITALYR